jgi:hypothetical protein
MFYNTLNTQVPRVLSVVKAVDIEMQCIPRLRVERGIQWRIIDTPKDI